MFTGTSIFTNFVDSIKYALTFSQAEEDVHTQTPLENRENDVTALQCEQQPGSSLNSAFDTANITELFNQDQYSLIKIIQEVTKIFGRANAISESLSNEFAGVKGVVNIVVFYDHDQSTDIGVRPSQVASEIFSAIKSLAQRVTDLSSFHSIGKLENITQILLHYKMVEKLTMPSNTQDIDLQAIAQFERLKKLNLANCDDITDKGLAFLTNLPNLKELYLNGCFLITDIGLAHLAKNLPTLMSLELDGCTLITDEGLGHLAKNLKALKYLHLKLCRNISDAGLLKLAELQNLIYIDMFRNITEAGFAKAIEINPSLKIRLFSQLSY